MKCGCKLAANAYCSDCAPHAEQYHQPLIIPNQVKRLQSASAMVAYGAVLELMVQQAVEHAGDLAFDNMRRLIAHAALDRIGKT